MYAGLLVRDLRCCSDDGRLSSLPIIINPNHTEALSLVLLHVAVLAEHRALWPYDRHADVKPSLGNESRCCIYDPVRLRCPARGRRFYFRRENSVARLRWLVSSGMFPPYRLVRSYALPLHYPNLFSWSFKLLLSIGFTNHGDKAYQVLTGSDYLGLNPGNSNSCFFASGLIVAVLFILGFVATHNVLNSKDSSATSAEARKPLDKNEAHIGLATAYSVLPNSSSRDIECGRLQEAAMSPILQRNPQTSQHAALTKFDDARNTCESILKCPQVDIALKNVSYRHETRPDHLALECISISFKTSTLSAIMGPSGAGTSTLLSLLAGSLTDGFVEGHSGTKQRLLQGQVLLNGTPINSEDFRSLGTLTPQDDFLPEVLTVRQVLRYTAELRSSQGGSSRSLAAASADAMLKLFSLLKVADTVVGTPSKIGISRGQKKRVSVAVDLLANRPVMLLVSCPRQSPGSMTISA